jgi:hypothetical protein
MKSLSSLQTTQLSSAAQAFLVDLPEIKQEILENSARGDFDAGFTPSVVEIKYEGLTFIRYENGEITDIRECSEGYVPPFWEVCFNEEEIALFVFGDGEVLLDRTGEMAEMDALLEQCTFFDKSEN